MKQRKSEINWKLVVRVACLMLLDVMLLYLACLLALLSRFDLSIHTLMRDSSFLPALHAAFPWMAIGMIALFIPLKLYSSLWEFAGVEELLHILCACFLFAAATLLLILFGVLDLPRSFPVLAGLYLVALLSASRFSYRLIRTILHRSGSEKRKKRTMLIGAGSAGMLVLREFQTSENSQNNVVCVIDDDRDKLGKYIRNVKIAGTRDDIVALAQSRRIEEIVLAIPTAAVRERRNILQLCQKTGCRLKILPGIYQLANGEVNIQKIRNVDVQDLLGRDCVEVDLSQIAGYLSGKTILVTGGGGSIGSEICRQIARCHPKKLIVLDIQEEGVYKLCLELRRKYKDSFELIDEIGSVRDVRRLDATFRRYRPDVVFHAAAHKHVPLMECNGCEAIKNNVIGTYNTANVAEKYGVSRFVLISTDKAVNPTNIMGASKRMCERVIQCRRDSGTVFTAVRFGNVLGSSGSVVPLFQQQIAAGGPVTVTDFRVTRYFMTIPEASQLVMQAGAMANAGELFVLHMGAPVHIRSLAENLVYMSGYVPYKSMQIIETGLRPGEKLYEELLTDRETCRKTANDLIYIETEQPPTRAEVDGELDILRQAVEASADEVESPLIREALKQVVPTFKEPDEVNRDAENAAEMQNAIDLENPGRARAQKSQDEKEGEKKKEGITR